MQLNLEHPDHAFLRRGANGTVAMVNERQLTASFVISPDKLVENWAVADASAMTMDDLAPLLAMDPELILLGTGEMQVFPPARTIAGCLALGIGVEAMNNAAAARTYSVLALEGRRVAAGFILAA